MDAIFGTDGGGDDHRGSLQPSGNDVSVNLILNLLSAIEFAPKFHTAHDARRGETGKVLGDEVIAGVAIGHVGEITYATDVLDVGEQDDFHILNSLIAADAKPGGVGVITARARATAW